jgi:hypothetical protein
MSLKTVGFYWQYVLYLHIVLEYINIKIGSNDFSSLSISRLTWKFGCILTQTYQWI